MKSSETEKISQITKAIEAVVPHLDTTVTESLSAITLTISIPKIGRPKNKQPELIPAQEAVQ